MTKTTDGIVGRQGRTYRERQGKRMLPKAQRRRVTIVMAEIDNPYFNAGHLIDATNPRKISAHRNANESPLVLMHHRGTINDVQAEAGLRFRRLYERVMAGTPSPGDIKERVDGGRGADPMDEGRMDAGRALRDAAAYMGRSEYWVVRTICGDGVSLREFAKMAGVRHGAARAALRSGLDKLAEVWRLAAEGHATRQDRAA